MHLAALTLRDYRNYRILELEFPRGVIVLTGENGAGKSNLLEAIHYLSYLKSFRTSRDREIVRFGAPYAVIDARFSDEQSHDFEVRLVLKDGKRFVRFNGDDVQKFQDYIGKLHSQFFFPGDLGIVTGDPALRREVLDLELLRLKPQLTKVMNHFRRAREQRNKLLKMIHPQPGVTRDNRELQQSFAAFSEQMVQSGAQLVRERLGITRVLDGLFRPLHRQLASEAGEQVTLDYISQVTLDPPEGIAASYGEVLAAAAASESSLRYTSVGPHRDDMLFRLGDGRDLKRFGSQGQMRSAALAFRLALCELSRQRMKDDPILMLDDALSEMDDGRKGRLMELAGRYSQVFITSASAREVGQIKRAAGQVYRVANGRVEPY
ncbi:DNA replication and repair protein RecF [bacterium]|nr:DNA replication and repair protein RecF [bacterium]